MEKPAKRFRKNIAGLLIIFFISSWTALSAKVSWAHLWNMKFKPTQDTIFTEEDNSFFVEIENVTPDSVQISVNSLPPNVSFVSQKKETVLIPREESKGGGYVHGTRIILWMRFTKTGWYKIKPIDLTIDGSFYSIPVETIEVFQNPRFIHPEINIVFQNQNIESAKRNREKLLKINSGDHIVFTVTARYMESVQNIFWNIPENSIFTKIKEYEFNSGNKEKNFITQFQNVATFDWQPLSAGEHKLPEIFITATSYNGSVEDIQCPVYKFNAEKTQHFIHNAQEDNPFVYAFNDAEKANSSAKKIKVKPQEILDLYELHVKERHAFIFSNAAAERKEAEEFLGLPSDYHEPSLFIFNVLCFLTLAFIALTVLFFIIKKKTLTAVFASVFILCAVFSGIYGIRVKTVRGVFTGGQMSPIPENNMLTSVTIQPGSVVFIVRNAGAWLYVKHNDTYGWIPADSVCIIK